MATVSTDLVKDLDAVIESDAQRVGGKALGLGRLLEYGFPVPPGFVVTTDAYWRSVEAAGLRADLTRLVEGLCEKTDNREVSERIGELFAAAGVEERVAAAIRTAYAGLGEDVPVAVRSSATAEDAADASFAGQQDTYLWIVGADNVVEHVLRCWASLFTAQAIGYRARMGTAVDDVAMAVVVQRMVPAVCAGVMMTLDSITGELDKIFVESAFGLGEAVVRGEVDPDGFLLDKSTLTVVREQIGVQGIAYRFLNAVTGVGQVTLPPDEGARRSLSPDEVRRLGELGRSVEQRFGRPMDIEWAVDEHRGIFLVQARPETVWSQRPVPTKPQEPPIDADGPLHSLTGPEVHWATSNLGEAMPGVQTPLSWTLWADAVEHAPREAAYQIGALRRTERTVPVERGQRLVRAFYGRPAIQTEFLALLGDRLPGTTGRHTVASVIGRAPETLDYRPTRRRYPIVAWRLPLTFVRTPGRIRALAAEQDRWYRDRITTVEHADLAECAAVLREAAQHLDRALVVQTTGIFGVIQPLHDALGRIVAAMGVGDLSALTGPSGGAEMAMVTDLWRASREQLPLTEVALRHGFHGPAEGELESLVWREDDAPLRALVTAYRQRPDTADPLLADQRRRRQRPDLEAEITQAAPWIQRPLVRLVLRLARTRLPLRGVAKRSFLQAFDVARAAARRIGAQLVTAGVLADPGDVFYLTLDELTGTLPEDAREVVTARRGQRQRYRTLALPEAWRGRPPAEATDTTDHAGTDLAATPTEDNDTISGVGVSAGVVEGVVRVLHEPDFEAVAPDEVLVAPTTDPSWSSIMFISAALVVDIGGALSHAAVVAREMGVPCIVNTRTGTSRLRTGDRVRVDGRAGTVTILARTEATTPQEAVS